MKYHIDFELDLKRNSDKGLYIALEGIDAAGKTTQLTELSSYFKSKGKKVVTTREPRKEGFIGDIIHQVLLGKVKIPAKALQYLFSTDRVIHHEELILPALERGDVVISDRSFWSAVVYGILDKNEENYQVESTDQLLVAQSILSFYHQFTVPDVTFYLKIPLSESLKRMEEKHKEDTKEIYEDKNKLEKVIGGYDWLFEKFSPEITEIDGAGSIEEVRDRMIAEIEKRK